MKIRQVRKRTCLDDAILATADENGTLWPERVFGAAEAGDPVLRPHFEWNVEKGWREAQLEKAARLIRNVVRIEIVPPRGGTLKVPLVAGVHFQQYIPNLSESGAAVGEGYLFALDADDRQRDQYLAYKFQHHVKPNLLALLELAELYGQGAEVRSWIADLIS